MIKVIALASTYDPSCLDLLEAVFPNIFQELIRTHVQKPISSIIFSPPLVGVDKVSMLTELCLNCHFDSTVPHVDAIVNDKKFVNFNL